VFYSGSQNRLGAHCILGTWDIHPGLGGEKMRFMDVWLQTERAAKSDSSRLRLTHSPRQATAMSQNNAREAMQRAKRDYPEYTWEMESGFSSGEFMLHGHDKEGSSRDIVPVLPQKETSGSLRKEIDELRIEVARLLSESEKIKQAAEKLAERIKRIEDTAL